MTIQFSAKSSSVFSVFKSRKARLAAIVVSTASIVVLSGNVGAAESAPTASPAKPAAPVVAPSTTPSAASSAPAAPGAPATAAEPAPPPEPTYKDGVVKVGKELKRTLGRVTDVEKGDNGCYLTLRDDKKSEFIEIGNMEFCTQKPSLKGQKVELTYSMETIQASSCYGDPKCRKTETVPLVVKVTVQN